MSSPIPSKLQLPHWQWVHLLCYSHFQRNYNSTSMPQSGRRPQHQSQTLCHIRLTSAFLLIATKQRTSHEVSSGPEADILPLYAPQFLGSFWVISACISRAGNDLLWRSIAPPCKSVQAMDYVNTSDPCVVLALSNAGRRAKTCSLRYSPRAMRCEKSTDPFQRDSASPTRYVTPPKCEKTKSPRPKASALTSAGLDQAFVRRPRGALGRAVTRLRSGFQHLRAAVLTALCERQGLHRNICSEAC